MSSILAILAIITVVIALVKISQPKKEIGILAPGPKPWPIIGNLYFIGKFRDLIDAFNNLKQEYGNVATVKLGVHDAVVICGLKNFREVLVDKASHFDARPAFKRYDLIFGGNKDNSLAFANGSAAHHKQRGAISIHSFAKNGSTNLENFENITTDRIFHMMENLKEQIAVNNKMDFKMLYAESIVSIFIKYFSNVDVDTEDELFKTMLSSFDLIFQEINSGCVGDVLPFLMNFINKNEYIEISEKVRAFVEKRCFEPIAKKRAGGEILDENNNVSKMSPEKPNDLINSLFDLVEQNDDISMEHIFFAFEDLIGGHAAVSNSLVRIIHHIAQHPEVQQKIRQEVREHAAGFPAVSDKLIYTEAAVWECFRFITSPVVPHRSTQDTTIDDFFVKKGTIVFFNNHDMNFNPDLWESPEKFAPERFISSEGRILKPEYYLPFSTGKRNCLGYKMAINVNRVIIANLCLNFNISLDPSVNYDMERGVIAVGLGKSFPFIYTPVEE